VDARVRPSLCMWVCSKQLDKGNSDDSYTHPVMHLAPHGRDSEGQPRVCQPHRRARQHVPERYTVRVRVDGRGLGGAVLGRLRQDRL